MKLFNIHPESTIGLVRGEIKAYEYNQSIELKQTTDSIDGFKNVYFVPSTEFLRSDFKKYYPEVNIKRKVDDADVIIFDNKTKKPSVKQLGNSHYYYYDRGFLVDADTLMLCRRYVRPNTDGWTHYSGTIIGVKEYERYEKIIKSGLPMVHVNTVFANFKSEVREFEFTEELAWKCFRQIQSDDIPSIQAALDITASLDPKVNLPFQSLIYSAFNANNVPVSQIRSNKFNVFKKFMYGKNFKFQRLYQNDSLWFHGRRFLDASPLFNLESFVNYVNYNNNFTEDMNYDLPLLCLTRVDLSMLGFKNVSLSVDVNSIKSDKITSQLITVEPLTVKEESKTEFDWGL